ncbi:hypothetical protein [Limnobacter sp.]|uniref:hypothetical protein n=1 Tax=Limnobacter sp. TaxID=2003368 RepID=UPI0025BB1CE1|nr:hypothetical protein [Limnobacter sp.]
MVIVYFESRETWSSYCEQVATFANEDIYMAALPALQKLASQLNCIVTETLAED